MNVYQQRRIIAVSSIIVFSLGVLSRLERGEEQFDTNAARFYIGVGITFTFISVFNDLGLDIGAAFALLVLVAAFMRQGDDVFKLIQKRSRDKKPGKKPQRRKAGRGQNR